MCGICGVVHPSLSGRTVDARTLERMRDTMYHRGPDDAGLFVDACVGLGHRRLSIVDVALGHQPMASDDGSVHIVYNGEVYNHPTLRQEIETAGIRYRTRCDTETVLRLFERHGERCADFLRGMFAFAAWNSRSRELVLVRDRFGVKPLYYALLPDGSMYFASEIKAILASGALRPRLNVRALPDYLANHSPSADETLFAGIRRLPAGHTLVWREGEVRITPYWNLSFGKGGVDAPEQELIAEYRERLEEAVRLRLMADVPLGVFLSGGIDSAAITAIMTRLTRDRVKTFSVGFAEREANELHYARLMARHCGTEHYEIVVSPAEFFRELPRLVWHEDEPIAHPSSIALNFVSQLAARHVKVVLTGEGSDETLAGYGRYRSTIYDLRVGRIYQRLTSSGMRRLVRGAIDRFPVDPRTRRRLRRTSLYLPATLEGLFLENFAVFSTAEQTRLVAPELRRSLGTIDPYQAIRTHLDGSDATTLLDRLLYADTKTYLHELLMKQDQMSMAASIESRVPFLDHPLVEFAARLPSRLKLRHFTTKYILRRAMADLLPHAVLSRRKMGFPVPVGRWLRGPYHHLVDEYVLGGRARERQLFDEACLRRIVHEHDANVVDHSERLWSLINLEIWQRLFMDGEEPMAENAPTYGGAASLAVAIG